MKFSCFRTFKAAVGLLLRVGPDDCTRRYVHVRFAPTIRANEALSISFARHIGALQVYMYIHACIYVYSYIHTCMLVVLVPFG